MGSGNRSNALQPAVKRSRNQQWNLTIDSSFTPGTYNFDSWGSTPSLTINRPGFSQNFWPRSAVPFLGFEFVATLYSGPALTGDQKGRAYLVPYDPSVDYPTATDAYFDRYFSDEADNPGTPRYAKGSFTISSDGTLSLKGDFFEAPYYVSRIQFEELANGLTEVARDASSAGFAPLHYGPSGYWRIAGSNFTPRGVTGVPLPTTFGLVFLGLLSTGRKTPIKLKN
jgi:hypothetical protein